MRNSCAGIPLAGCSGRYCGNNISFFFGTINPHRNAVGTFYVCISYLIIPITEPCAESIGVRSLRSEYKFCRIFARMNICGIGIKFFVAEFHSKRGNVEVGVVAINLFERNDLVFADCNNAYYAG